MEHKRFAPYYHFNAFYIGMGAGADFGQKAINILPSHAEGRIYTSGSRLPSGEAGFC